MKNEETIRSGEHLAFKHAADLCKKYRKENKMLKYMAAFEAIAAGALILWKTRKLKNS